MPASGRRPEVHEERLGDYYLIDVFLENYGAREDLSQELNETKGMGRGHRHYEYQARG